MITNTISNFISNDVKGIRSSEKRLQIFEYLKNNYVITVLFFSKNRSSHRRCSVFLEVLQNSQENTCVRVSFSIKLQEPKAILSFWGNTNLPTPTNEQALECEGIISQTELYYVLFLCCCFVTARIYWMLLVLLCFIDNLMLYYYCVFCSGYCIFENLKIKKILLKKTQGDQNK